LRSDKLDSGTVFYVEVVINRPKVNTMDTPEDGSRTQERIIDDLRLVIENAEELLRNTDQYTSMLYQNARTKLTMALTAASEELARFEDAQLARMIDATRAANERYDDKTGEQRILRAFRYQ
jgi:ElaB/YqjD/DUF883 family membrane-anchored ribosome-binding protein